MKVAVRQENSNHTTTTSSPNTADDEHNTLKYHLLGPSLTKAGQDAVDQQKANSSKISYRLGADVLVRFQK